MVIDALLTHHLAMMMIVVVLLVLLLSLSLSLTFAHQSHHYSGGLLPAELLCFI